MSRYERQIILPELGEVGQHKLEYAHVVVVGAGGLGVPVLQYLAGAGAGYITIIDPDLVSENNLHRQVIYQEDQIGAPKADCAAKILHGMNSNISIKSFKERIAPDNVAPLLEHADIVLDCADSFAASYILSDYCFAHKIPFVSASALGLSGYVGAFCGGAPSLRAVFPELPNQAASCASAGVMGPVVGTIGSLQAQMALAIIAELSPSPLGQFLQVDLKTYRTSSFDFSKAPEPARDLLTFMSQDQLTARDYVVELRADDETEHAITAHAKRITIDDFQRGYDCPKDSNQRAVFVCRSGLRAHRAAKHLRTYWDGEIALIATG